MGNTFRIATLLRALIGAGVGGIVGYFAFEWILKQGFYAMILPGAAIGIGCGALTRGRFTLFGILSAILAVGLGVFVEWRFYPFVKDDSLSYFITHVHDLKPVSLLMIGFGAVLAFHFGVGRIPMNRMDAPDRTSPGQPPGPPVGGSS
jgi:hypothetical protein